ncbi:hypothetical protein [Paludibacterium purpuratum]|uniref:Uncharacterized protein n=1 Tax=Paludibacterium purpuratum TaxID=1144873 RepID=A0A4R7BCW6_9NEIS|nr:hypothetical protein [Paludibacterium purpuratum]TDR81467.1 hypothetical protein DFP86_103120 [Paludibacterium purpuratum]
MKTISFALLTSLALHQGIAQAAPAWLDYFSYESLQKMLEAYEPQPDENTSSRFAFTHTQPHDPAQSELALRGALFADSMHDFRKGLCPKASPRWCQWQARQTSEYTHFAQARPQIGQQVASVFRLGAMDRLILLLGKRNLSQETPAPAPTSSSVGA